MAGSTLVLVPPVGLGEVFWAPVLPALRASVEDVVVWDAATAKPSSARSADGIAEALFADLADLGLDGQPVDVAGLGWGGAFALHVAETRPASVRRLALLSTAPDTVATFRELVLRIAVISGVFADYLPHKPVLGMRDHAELARSEGMGAEADAILRAAFMPGREQAFSGESAALRDRLLALDAEHYARLCEAVADEDIIGRLRSVQADTLILAANDDWSVPPGTSRVAALGIPVSERVVVRDAAAFLFHPDPAHVAGLLIDHFTKDD